jgi:hypothetical protein
MCNHQEQKAHNVADEAILMGFDKWGYNYQAHMFHGKYCQANQNASWCQVYSDTDMEMKWNNAWLSTKDCDRDGKLDMHFGHDEEGPGHGILSIRRVSLSIKIVFQRFICPLLF